MTSAEELNASIESLGASIDKRLADDAALIARLKERLSLIERAALDRIDGDSQPSDTHWSEIVGIACGDPNWLQHAKANYDVKHAELVKLATEIIERVIDEFQSYSLADTPRVAEIVADQIEQEILPAMVIGEDGRTFLRSQGQPYPP